MAKVYEIADIELREGVKGEHFERFWLQEYGPQGRLIGWISHLVKADRGERAGKYRVIWEMPSVEWRDRLILPPHEITEEALRLLGPNFPKLNEILFTLIADYPYAHYIELGG
jgi:hypothetical protein